MENYKTILACAAITSVFGSASAQSLSEIESIKVTGSRLNVSADKIAAQVTVIDQAQITQSGAVLVTDLLRGLPGITVAQSGGVGALTEIRVRGSETNHVLVLIDGVVANDEAQGGLIDLAHLTSSNVARIEFLRGPQSALWGSGAVSGVISITTVSGAMGDQFQSTLSAGTQNTKQFSARAAKPVSYGQLGAYITALNTQGSNVALQGEEDDGYDNLTAGVQFSTQLNDENTLTLSARHSDYEVEYDSSNGGVQVDADNVTDGSRQHLQILWKFTPKDTNYHTSLQLIGSEDDNNSVNSGLNTGGTTGNRLQATWLNVYDVNDNWQIAAGAEWVQRLFQQRGTASDWGDPNQKQDDVTRSVLTEVNGHLTTSTNVSASARFDNNSRFDNATSWRVGITQAINTEISLFASTGEAVRAPSFTELFGFFAASFVGNPNLRPEKSQNWELGFSWQPTPALSVDVSWFNSKLTDEINGFAFNADLGLSTAENMAGDSNREGLDLSATATLPGAKLQLTYGYLDAKQPSGVDETRRASHQGAMTLYSDLKDSDWSGYIKLAYTGSRQDDSFATWPATKVNLRPYTLLSANLEYQFNAHWLASLRLENVLDTDYQDVVSYAGRPLSALFSVSYRH
ncbi:TonB-dependent receptor [Alteromonas sediminis]|uniref:TonB-dependent receptor n=1 Tax=Alteromonas sediminis TaxID=2259342 RepID=A0A3N5YLH8_9ALTE|nr:TonB-dependent receptor [Alteromonas sediminis]RPJ65991.1 TonB-dependent receptor [Alteromonas sediminis]